MQLNPGAIDLGALPQLWLGAPARPGDASMQRSAEPASSVDRIGAGGETV